MTLPQPPETIIKKFPKKAKFSKLLRNYGTPISVLIGALIIGGSIYLSNGAAKTDLPKSSGSTVANPPSGPAVAGTVEVSADDDPVLGSDNAPVTMIEFSDFQCPFCRQFWRQNFSQIKSQYIDTGKVKLVYRDFPLSIHPSSEIAAEAGECAHEQGKFWQMHDKIFAEQDKQGTGTILFELADLKKWGQAIGLNTVQFNNCLDSSKYRSEVEKDSQDAQNSGVLGTPGFFINRHPISGAQPLNVFVDAIDAALKK